MPRTISAPDLGPRPFTCTVEREMSASPERVYAAFTTDLDQWFAPGVEVVMTSEVDAPFFFQLTHEGNRYTHYGRFLKLDPDKQIQITWVTGEGGTRGEESVVTIDIVPHGDQTLVRVTHAGLPNEEARAAYAGGWPEVLEALEGYAAKTEHAG